MDNKDKDHFKLVKRMLAPKGKAYSEEEASKNPMEWLKKHKNMNIKNLKGVAF